MELAFYRKYRPGKLSEIVGQPHIVSSLEGALKAKQTSHAYLFSGPRGTGKTSVARILAQELGCQPEDLYEIDAASNRGIDEIRELRDAVRSNPFRSPVKVYIIDEVHMLTREAFNALLKTLEEPPSYAVFILATTELHKVPDTIVSRCQTFTFRRPTTNELSEVLEKIAKAEKIKLDEPAAELLAFLGDGSYRDAIRIFEQVVSASKGKAVTREIVEEITGAPRAARIQDFVNAMLEKNVEQGLSAIRTISEQGGDIKFFAKLSISWARTMLLYKEAPKMREEIESELTPEQVKILKSLNESPNTSRLPFVLKALLDVYPQIGLASVPELPLELALLTAAEK